MCALLCNALTVLAKNSGLHFPDRNSFEETAPSKLRSVSPAQWTLFVLFFLIAVCGFKTQLRSTISLTLRSQRTSLLALFLRSTCCRYPHPLAVSVGSRCCSLVPLFLPPPSERSLCPRHEVTFHPFLSFILLSTQISNVAALNSLLSKFAERGLEVSWLLFDLFVRLRCCASVVLGIHFAIGCHFFYQPSS